MDGDAGIDIEEARKLDDIQARIEEGNRQIRRILEHFSMKKLDVAQIQRVLEATQGPRRKILARQAHQLGEIMQVYQTLLKTRKQIQESVGRGVRDTSIRVWGQAYRNLDIRIGDLHKRLAEPVSEPRFHVRDGALVDR